MDCKHIYRGEENIDYVICMLCGLRSKSLGIHIKRHGISVEYYHQEYGPTICSNSRDLYSKINFENGNWINRAKINGTDLSDYWQKVSKGVKLAINSNPKELKRRATMRAAINKTPFMRKIASEAAKKTSARPEIQKQRTEQLKKWRDNNPKDFYEKCVSKLLNSWQSQPEKMLFNIVVNYNNYNFSRNQKIKSTTFTSKSKIKQIDIGDRSRRIYLEYDGPLHFLNKLGQYKYVHEKDILLNECIENRKWVLIRVSYDQFSYKYGGLFSEKCMNQIFKILNDPKPGVYYIGKAYCNGKY